MKEQTGLVFNLTSAADSGRHERNAPTCHAHFSVQEPEADGRLSAALRSEVPGRAERPPEARVGSGSSSRRRDPGERVVCITMSLYFFLKSPLPKVYFESKTLGYRHSLSALGHS